MAYEFSITSSANDGYLQQDGATYPPTGGVAYNDTADILAASKSNVTTFFRTQLALLRFDTSTLPDNGTVASAILRLRTTVDVNDGGDGRSLIADWAPLGTTLGVEDYAETVGTNAHSGTLITAITASALNDFALQNVGNILRTGFTDIRVGISGGSPAGLNYVNFVSFDDASLQEPRLIVEMTGVGALQPRPIRTRG